MRYFLYLLPITLFTANPTFADNPISFSNDFSRAMIARAEMLNHYPQETLARLKQTKEFQPYRPTSIQCDVDFEGVLEFEGNMRDFLRSWSHHLDQGFGLNDRYYTDIVDAFAKRGQNLTALQYTQLRATDVFDGSIRNGKMIWAREVIKTTGIFGLLLSSSTQIYSRTVEPEVRNRFEEVITNANCDMAKVQDFYRISFDPKRIDPNLTLTVKVTMKQKPGQVSDKKTPKQLYKNFYQKFEFNF